MSDPLSEVCKYCGSTDVLDDAWFCASNACWAAWQAEERAAYIRRVANCTHKFAADPGMFDSSLRYCVECGLLDPKAAG